MNKLFSLFILCLTMNSCVPVALGTGTVVSYNIAQERSFGTSVDDMAIWSQIKAYYAKEDGRTLIPTININVNEGRVLLTGQVKDVQTRITAVRLAWKPKGVIEVINELEIQNKDLLKTYAKDAWITTQVKSRLLFDRSIKSINYTVETDNEVVYLIGIADSEEELHKATDITSKVRGVSKVVSYVRIKD